VTVTAATGQPFLANDDVYLNYLPLPLGERGTSLARLLPARDGDAALAR
jgi:hypothetical protein